MPLIPIEGPIRRPERGESMGANKNSSRRMNSAYAPSSQPRIPTWVCQGHIVTTDLPTLGTNPNSKRHESTTQEANDLGNLHSLGRTVRGARQTVCKHRTDRPKMPPDLPVLHLEKRIVCALPADHTRETRAVRTVRDERANCPQTSCNQK
jgi:hypothetical protein